MEPLLLVPAAASLVLVAAKAHGRQVRLERELEGHREVVFGGENPPFVQALWARDRVRFWTLFPLLALAASGLHAALRGPSWALLAAVAWGAGAAFLACGLWSLAGLLRALPRKPHDEAWRRVALRGSAAWWTPAAGLLVLVAWLAW